LVFFYSLVVLHFYLFWLWLIFRVIIHGASWIEFTKLL
jgi:hypothetical protein